MFLTAAFTKVSSSWSIGGLFICLHEGSYIVIYQHAKIKTMKNYEIVYFISCNLHIFSSYLESLGSSQVSLLTTGQSRLKAEEWCRV